MKPEEAIEDIRKCIQPSVGGKSLQMAIEALEKQVAKKPRKQSYEPLIKHGWKYECPECGKAVGINSFSFDYTDEDDFCPSCSQKIDWSEEE